MASVPPPLTSARRRVLDILHERSTSYVRLSEGKAATLARLAGGLLAINIVQSLPRVERFDVGDGRFWLVPSAAFIYLCLAIVSFRMFCPRRGNAARVGASEPDREWVTQVHDEAKDATRQMGAVKGTIVLFGITVLALLINSWLGQGQS